MSGPPTTALLRVLGPDAQLVSYGAMSKQPLALPTGLHIFRGLVARGFWMSRWYAEHGRAEREALLREVVSLEVRSTFVCAGESGADVWVGGMCG